MMVEKAFAKLRGSYERLNGGNTSEAMVELTGGVSEKINLKVTEPTQNFWTKTKTLIAAGHLVGCASIKRSDTGEQIDGRSALGIQYNHAYSLSRMEEFPKLQLRLVKIKNPWGVGSEWQGAFSDDSKIWEMYPKLREEL